MVAKKQQDRTLHLVPREPASPQLEKGYARTANELHEAFGRTDLNGAQFRLLHIITRNTYGRGGEKKCAMAVSQLVAATGLARAVVIRELGRLEQRNVIFSEGAERSVKVYGIQKDHSRWLTREEAAAAARGDLVIETAPDESGYQSVTSEPDLVTENDRSGDYLVSNLATSQSPSKDKKKDLKKKTTTTDAPAREERITGQSLSSFWKAALANAKGGVQQIDVLLAAYDDLFGESFDRAALVRHVRLANSARRILNLMFEMYTRDDIVDYSRYLAKMVALREQEGWDEGGPPRRGGYVSQADINSGKSGRFVQ